jgi:uridine phosphorylase
MVTVDHLELEEGMATVAIITGDPARAVVVATSLGAHLVSDKRGFACYLAPQWKRPLVIVATGIGGPATAIVVEELIILGVKAIIRLGTCGSLQPQVRPGHIVVAAGCVREEGTSVSYIGPSFPALSNGQLCSTLTKGAQAAGAVVHLGITHCKDAYYSEKQGMQPDSEFVRNKWSTWRNAGVLATEMEAAPLFVIASLRGVAAAALFIAVGKTASEGYDKSVQQAISACDFALRAFIDSGALDELKPRSREFGPSFLRPQPEDE